MGHILMMKNNQGNDERILMTINDFVVNTVETSLIIMLFVINLSSK